MPAEILLEVARYHHHRSLKIREESAALLAQPEPKTKRAKQDFAEQLNGMEIEIRTENAMATSAADKAAPYYNSKLATLQTAKPLNAGGLTLAQLVEGSFTLTPPANDDQPALPAPVDKIDAAE